MRQAQNLEACKDNRAENWMAEKLSATGLKWRRQAMWGFRLFDFWNAELGIAVEVDGPRWHDPDKDALIDLAHWQRSAIIVLRVPPFDPQRTASIIRQIAEAEPWLVRRERMGLLTKFQKKRFEADRLTPGERERLEHLIWKE
jgi:very-short-patch-repair endonuclease